MYPFPPLTPLANLPHQLSVHPRFIQTVNTGVLPSGQRTRNAPIATSFFNGQYFRSNALRSGLPRVSPGSPDLRTASDRFWEALGSNTNRANFVLTDRELNGVKGRLFILRAPIAHGDFRQLVRDAAAGDDDATEHMIEELRTVSCTMHHI